MHIRDYSRASPLKRVPTKQNLEERKENVENRPRSCYDYAIVYKASIASNAGSLS